MNATFRTRAALSLAIVVATASCGGSTGTTTTSSTEAVSETSEASSTSEAAWTLTRDEGVLTIGITHSIPTWPIIMEDDTGALIGLYPDLLQELAEPMGLAVEWVSAESDDSLYLQLATGRIDLAIPSSEVPPEVRSRVEVSHPYATDQLYLLFNSEAFPALRLTDLDRSTVLVVPEWLADHLPAALEEQGTQIATIGNPTEADFEIAATYEPSTPGDRWLVGAFRSDAEDAMTTFPTLDAITVDYWYSSFVLDPTRARLVDVLNAQIDSFPDGFVDDLQTFWYSLEEPTVAASDELPSDETGSDTTEATSDDTTTAAPTSTTAPLPAPATVARTRFGPYAPWTDGSPLCHINCYFVDVTGDGAADFVAHDNDAIYVMRSTGTSFGPPEKWTTGSPICNINCYIVDVTGDGKADFIAHDNDAINVMPSTGSSFAAHSAWTNGSPICNINCYIVDVTGDGAADFIAHDNDAINVVPAI
jgi:hypothetical protein